MEKNLFNLERVQAIKKRLRLDGKKSVHLGTRTSDQKRLQLSEQKSSRLRAKVKSMNIILEALKKNLVSSACLESPERSVSGESLERCICTLKNLRNC